MNDFLFIYSDGKIQKKPRPNGLENQDKRLIEAKQLRVLELRVVTNNIPASCQESSSVYTGVRIIEHDNQGRCWDFYDLDTREVPV